ncbi:MAG: hypothetical protein AB8G99_03750 [Planctomycetaceae bacterium]
MGVELELSLLLFLSLVGQVLFGRFELEVNRFRLLLRWAIVTGLTLGLYVGFGHLAAAVPLLAAAAGLAVHFLWCNRNGIHPLHATPRERYYRLRGWTTGNEWAPIITSMPQKTEPEQTEPQVGR